MNTQEESNLASLGFQAGGLTTRPDLRGLGDGTILANWDKIIETRLGYHEQEPKEAIEKLKSHTGMIIIVTPDGEKSLTSGETAVLRIPFHEFVKDSKALLGVKLRHTEVQSLSNKLKRKLYWNQ